MRTYCPVCNRPRKLTVHHLFPTVDSKWKGRQECELCKDCHVELHRRFDNRTLRNRYNSITNIATHGEKKSPMATERMLRQAEVVMVRVGA